jgi:competence protein ComEC
MRFRSTLLATLLAATAVTAAQPPAPPTAQVPPDSDASTGLRFSFVDVEGGAATLIVTPAGESILIDSGFPGDRDAGRIAQAARQMGITEIHHYITTHYHTDHVGGIASLAKVIPVRATYGHRLPEPLPGDINADQIAAWKAVSATPTFLAVGDSISLRGKRGTPTPKLRVLAANGLVEGEKEGAPAIITCDKGHEAQPEDTSDNARSLVLHLNFGDFDLLAGGDLTWNIEHKLVCPRRRVPTVDVYLVNHHGGDTSNNPALLDALEPEVAIVNNGPRKGADPRTLTHLIKQLRDVGVFQLHRSVKPGAVNTESGRIANHDEACKGELITLRVEPNSGQFVVSIPSRHVDRAFSAK